MKNLPLVTAVLCGFVVSSIAHDLRISDIFWRWKIEKAINSSIENFESQKSDCEKSIPRDQECVMVFDFVPVKKERQE